MWAFFVVPFVVAATGFLMGGRSWRRAKSARRFSRPQFTLSTLFTVVSAFAVLVGQLQWFDAAPWQWVAVIVFFGIVWGAQHALFRARRPWLASVLVGAAVGFFLWLRAWGAIESGVLWTGLPMTTADFVRDLFLAVVLGIALAVAAKLLWAWSFAVVTCLGILWSRPTSRAGRQRISPDSQSETGEASSAETDASAEGESRCDGGDPRRAAILSAATGALLLIAAMLLQNPIQIWYHRHAADYCLARGRERRAPPPVEALLLSFGFGPYGLHASHYFEWNEANLERLVELGYLAHREFIFHHVPTGDEKTRIALLRRVFAQDSESSYGWCYKPGDSPDKPLRYWIEVWDRPSEMPKWEAFVREVDRPDFPENTTP